MAFDFQQLSEAVLQLKKYYEIEGRDDVIRQAVNSTTRDNSASNKAIDFFLNVIEGGKRIDEIIKDIKQLDDNDVKELGNSLLIWYEADRSNLPLVVNYQQETGKEGTINEMAGDVVNTHRSSANKSTTSVSIIQVLPANITPASRFSDACALFLTAIPTVEMSRAMPHLDIKMLSPNKPLDSSGKLQGLSINKFLVGNNPITSEKSAAIINASSVTQNTLDGERDFTSAGMEIFTSPQTLVPGNDSFETNIGNRSSPIIDKFRPFLSIKSFELEVVPTFGMLSYKTAKLQLVLHDRSRLGEIADLVRPDLYSAVELLIEYGWSHPDNTGNNAYGLLINSMRTREKYGVMNSSFTFDDSGQVNVTVELFMKGVTDFSTSKIAETKETADLVNQIENLTRAISNIKNNTMRSASVKEIRGTTLLDSTSDTTSALNLSKDAKKAIDKYLSDSRNGDIESDGKLLRDSLVGLYGTDGTDGEDGAVGQLNSTLDDSFRRKLAAIKGKDTIDPPLFYLNQFFDQIGNPLESGYVSFAKLLLLFVGEPLASTAKFDEVQILFYSFNSGAGAMRTSNIGSFPIDISDFSTNFQKNIESRGRFNITLSEFVEYVANNFIDDISNDAYGISNNIEFDLTTKFKNGERQPPQDADDDITILNSSISKRMKALGIPDGEFLMPEISMYIETVPLGSSESAERFVGDSGPSLLKIHITDKQSSPHLGFKKLLDAMLDKNLGTFGEPSAGSNVEDLTKQTELAKSVLQAASTPTEDGGPGLIEEITRGSHTYKLTDTATPSGIKKFIAKSAPTIRYGNSTSNIKQISVQSLQDPALNTVHMQRAGLIDTSQAPGVDGEIVPMQMLPTELSMDTMGCPLMNFGQQLFIDLDTGTTVDNIYGIVGLTHKLESGNFESSFKMINIDAYGKFRSSINSIQSAISILNKDIADGE